MHRGTRQLCARTSVPALQAGSCCYQSPLYLALSELSFTEAWNETGLHDLTPVGLECDMKDIHYCHFSFVLSKLEISTTLWVSGRKQEMVEALSTSNGIDIWRGQQYKNIQHSYGCYGTVRKRTNRTFSYCMCLLMVRLCAQLLTNSGSIPTMGITASQPKDRLAFAIRLISRTDWRATNLEPHADFGGLLTQIYHLEAHRSIHHLCPVSLA